MDLYVLAEFVIVLAASVLIIFLSHKLRLPSVVGFLLTGVLIGPGGLSLVKNTATVDVMAEIGVVMLLFTIGLEFEPARLKRIQRDFWAGGGLQVSLTVSATVLVLLLFRVPVRTAIFYGFLVSLSSTAVVMRILSDRGETDAPYGRLSLGILIFQDIAIVPMVAFGPVLETVCFHDPCHLRHGQKLVLPQRNLLERVPGLTFRDIPDEGQCCGSAGIYNITHHERSMKILEAKVSAISRTGAERVVTSNPGCFMQLQYARQRWSQAWRVCHMSEILRLSLERGTRTQG